MTVAGDQQLPAFFGWTEEALREALYTLPRSALVMIPGMQVIERPGWWQLITPSFRQGGLNEVSLSLLDEASADAVIDRALADYRSRGLSLRWSLFPGFFRPADLGERLRARGLREVETIAMAKRIRAPSPGEQERGRSRGRASSGIELRLCDETDIDVYTAVMARGWGIEPGPLGDYNRRALGASGCHRFYIARPIGGEWCAAAGSVLFGRSAHLLGAVVLPEARGQGLYRALVAARAEDAIGRGTELATTHAWAATSAPILRHLGFVECGRFSSFQTER